MVTFIQLNKFFKNDKIGGLILISCTVISLLLTNGFIGDTYQNIWDLHLGGLSLVHWINDGLMSIYFLLIGLDLRSEIRDGELSNIKNALLPVFAAVGGILVPAGIYLMVNQGTENLAGAGIPMATDVAFALGVLSLLGSRVPLALKVFLTALAAIDDMSAIIVIAFFYTKSIDWSSILIVFGICVALWTLRKAKIYSIFPYLAGGIILWYFMLRSGVHPTIGGVILAFLLPTNGKPESGTVKLHVFLEQPVTFFILPLFALANTAIFLSGDLSQALTQPYSIGIAIGLIVGKPLGIVGFTFLAVKFGMAELPAKLNWTYIIGAGIIGGIGFTISIFISLLAFENETIIKNSKLVVLLSSLIAAIAGYLYLNHQLKPLSE